VLLQTLIAQHQTINKHIFLVGPPGCGKSLNIQHVTQFIPNTIEINLKFSSQTSVDFISDNLEYKLTQQRKKGRMMLLPPPQKSLLLLVDDVNMPSKDSWGSHPPIELLRQIIDQSGFYD
jgi:dynein heavy chain, axonemal